MKDIYINNINDLSLFFSRFKDSYLFRGQIRNYPTLSTSRYRSGCCSIETIKWSSLALDIIRCFVHRQETIDINRENVYNYGEAILQHYGYTSYFLDTTTKPEVACWFASHKAKVKESFVIVEDCNEQGVMTKRRKIKYCLSHEKEGHIYMIDKGKIDKESVFDLVDFIGNDSTCRFVTQGAVMIVNILTLPKDVIEAHVIVPTTILNAYSEQCNIKSTEQLFPNYHDDLIYRLLKSVHWLNVNNTGVYRQALEIPEYEDCGKIQADQIAYYTHFNLCKKYPELAQKINYTIQVDSFFFYIEVPNDNNSFSCVLELIKKHKSILFEANDLIDYPEFPIYIKGILISIHQNYLYLEPIDLSYKGQIVTRVQITKPWIYAIIGTELKLIQHPDSCPCNNAFRHQRDFFTLSAIEDSLKQNLNLFFAALEGEEVFLKA